MGQDRKAFQKGAMWNPRSIEDKGQKGSALQGLILGHTLCLLLMFVTLRKLMFLFSVSAISLCSGRKQSLY